MNETFTNKEIDKGKSLSGMAYVASHLKGDPSGEFGRIVIAAERNCGHVNRICTECAKEWGYDHELLWERTAGGRKLKARIDAKQSNS